MAAVLFKWLMTGLVSLLHPFYVGVTEIEHNAANKTLEISVKLFIDDFESALTRTTKESVNLLQPRDSNRTNQVVANYLAQHLKLKVNGKPVILEFVGYEHEREAAWCYVQVSGIPAVKTLEMTNTLLYESFDTQINLLHVTVNGERKSTKLVNPDQQASFQF